MTTHPRESTASTKTPVARPDVFGSLLSLRNDFDRLFEGFFTPAANAPSWFSESRTTFQPSVDVTENDTEVMVTAELPGMDEKDIEVNLQGDILSLKGEKKEERSESKDNAHRTERYYGTFVRTIPLPCEVDHAKVAATFAKGVLKVTMPKTAKARAQSHRITVKGG